jgi:hypothetical protein
MSNSDDDTPRLRPICPDWCTPDHQTEAADAREDGYLHQAKPYRLGPPGHPELPAREQQHLVLDLAAMQQPDPEADVPLQVALRQAAHTLEQWGRLLPDAG